MLQVKLQHLSVAVLISKSYTSNPTLNPTPVYRTQGWDVYDTNFDFFKNEY